MCFSTEGPAGGLDVRRKGHRVWSPGDPKAEVILKTGDALDLQAALQRGGPVIAPQRSPSTRGPSRLDEVFQRLRQPDAGDELTRSHNMSR